MARSKNETKENLYSHVMKGGAVTATVHLGTIILSPYVKEIGIGVWLVTDEENDQKHKRIQLFASKNKSDVLVAVEIFFHLAVRNTYEFYNPKASFPAVIGEPKKRKPIPITVERYYSEHISKGVPEKQAWALAWSRYCKYSYPGSKRCQKKPSQYFTGRI
jgi:hypothetical protein